ncbi:MAG: cytochrome b [Acidiferrobacteraceae bacterium]
MSKLLEWVDARFPLTSLWEEHLSKYYAPKNFNFWYYFGSLALFLLVNQIITGIFLTMNYAPDTHLAFASVQYIMRDVKWGWLIRYLHVVGASMFFVVVYLHMFRAMLYGSYRKPRELIWIFGMVIFLALMAEAFMGYLLPWGNMSFWGAQVITSLFGAIPVIGHGLQTWIRGSFSVSDATLNRFFALHVIAVPLALAALVLGHIMALHEVGSNNPDGIEIKEKKDAKGVPLDGIPFHPYYTVKDIFGLVVFLFIFLAIVFFIPGLFGWFLDRNNYVPANMLQTPADVVPLWYFTPFYAILRSMNHSFLGVPAKELGLTAFILSIVLFFFLPWLDRSPVKSIRYRGWMYKTALTVFVISFLGLGYLGTQPVSPKTLSYGHLFVTLYFAFFVLMPWYTKYDKTKPVPERVTQ